MFKRDYNFKIIQPNKKIRKIKEKTTGLMPRDPLKKPFNMKVMTSC